jgi:hypothetical protein
LQRPALINFYPLPAVLHYLKICDTVTGGSVLAFGAQTPASVTNFFPVRVAHTLLETFTLLYRCTLSQPLYTCAYLQLLRRGLESKALPVKNYGYRQTDRTDGQTESHMEAAHCLKILICAPRNTQGPSQPIVF